MRKFNVNVNGVNYEVAVEEVGAGQVQAVPQVVQAAPVVNTQAPATAPKQEEKKVQTVAGEAVKAPMPGQINDIKVAVGNSVKKGDVLVILEAMKMENEIVAPRDAKIAQVVVSKGASVNTGDSLIVLE